MNLMGFTSLISLFALNKKIKAQAAATNPAVVCAFLKLLLILCKV